MMLLTEVFRQQRERERQGYICNNMYASRKDERGNHSVRLSAFERTSRRIGLESLGLDDNALIFSSI